MTLQSCAMSPCFSRTVTYSPPKPSIRPLLSKSLKAVKRKKNVTYRIIGSFGADKLITIALDSCYKKTGAKNFFSILLRLR